MIRCWVSAITRPGKNQKRSRTKKAMVVCRCRSFSKLMACSAPETARECEHVRKHGHQGGVGKAVWCLVIEVSLELGASLAFGCWNLDVHLRLCVHPC